MALRKLRSKATPPQAVKRGRRVPAFRKVARKPACRQAGNAKKRKARKGFWCVQTRTTAWEVDGLRKMALRKLRSKATPPQAVKRGRRALRVIKHSTIRSECPRFDLRSNF